LDNREISMIKVIMPFTVEGMRHIRIGKLSASPWPRGSRAPYAHRIATARELAGLTVVRRLLHLGGDGVSALRNLRADQAPGLLGGRRAASQLGEGPALPEAGPERRLVLYKGTPEECRQALEEHGDWVTRVLEGVALLTTKNELDWWKNK
jgi:hypothetical protein